MPFVTPNDLISIQPDYVVVGGGTSGLTLAARLTENPNTQVVVVEAGLHHGPTPEIDIPGYMGRSIANPKFDWTFLSVPQKRANHRVVLQPRGKGLGGSSLNNFLGIFRPSKDEIDAIEQLGNPGWNWDSLLYYLKKSETLQLPDLTADEAAAYAAQPDPVYHGADGPIKNSFGPIWADLHLKLFESAEALGIQRNPETGNGRNDGCMTSLVSVDATTAKRSYAASAYLEPNLHRQNLHVLTEAYVTKVLLESTGDLQRAVGIEYIKDGKTLRIDNVKRDIVISGGTLQTPQILELSGIGNKSILSKYGIKTIIDVPGVGENLQDHVGVSTIAEVDTHDETMDVLADPAFLKKHEELYEHRKGLFASVPAPAFVFLPADALGSPEDIRSWKEHAQAKSTEVLADVIPSLKSGLEKQYKVQQQLFDDKVQSQAELLQFAGRQPMPYAPPAEPGKRYTSLFCALTHPLSRGSVHIASADPLAPPAIDPNYFANDADLTLVVRVVQAAIRLYNTPPLSNHVKKLLLPPPDAIARGEEGLADYVRDNCGPVYHPVGTAAMMPREDGGVVDPTLKVYGTSNLRVVDCSIIPLELSCHTQSIAYAIGEKAADILKAEIARA
ncbi:GMC oxidoreductase [Trametes coccinea BRFM310]|uniref:GMC oxidoreductase n=1 Tax=Trametes coccinea (strain BRFM310) TaxID=1353009 RepID=A0A1Y2III4_TRAC3|nr:GMC oxidoreductase [Trametes coccinea BRFM310]